MYAIANTMKILLIICFRTVGIEDMLLAAGSVVLAVLEMSIVHIVITRFTTRRAIWAHADETSPTTRNMSHQLLLLFSAAAAAAAAVITPESRGWSSCRQQRMDAGGRTLGRMMRRRISIEQFQQRAPLSTTATDTVSSVASALSPCILYKLDSCTSFSTSHSVSLSSSFRRARMLTIVGCTTERDYNGSCY